MIKTYNLKIKNSDTINEVLTSLPDNSFRQLLPLENFGGNRPNYMLIIELTEEQEKTWTPTFTVVKNKQQRFLYE